MIMAVLAGENTKMTRQGGTRAGGASVLSANSGRLVLGQVRALEGCDALQCSIQLVVKGGTGDVIARPDAHPEIGAGSEIPSETRGGVRCQPGLLAHKTFYSRARHAERLGELAGTEAERIHEFLAEIFSRVNRRVDDQHCAASSVIVDDLDILGIVINPAKADAPLPVDPDRILTGPSSAQCLQPIGRRHAQRIECWCRVERHQSKLSRTNQIRRKAPWRPSRKLLPDAAVSRRSDHLLSVSFDDTPRNRNCITN